MNFRIFTFNFRIIRNIFGNRWASLDIFGYSQVIFENPGHSHDENLTSLSQKKLSGKLQLSNPVCPIGTESNTGLHRHKVQGLL